MAIIRSQAATRDGAFDFADTSRFVQLRRLLQPGDPLLARAFREAPDAPAQHQPKGRRSVVARQWARSGVARAKENVRSIKPYGSWEAAVDRARRSWDELTGGPGLGFNGQAAARYSDVAAAAILRTALGLWPDVAASMAEGEPAE